MSAKETVLRAYPKAAAQELKAIPRTEGTHGKIHWRIHADDKDISKTIGEGSTEEAAWQDAAKRLQKSK
jgi:hypothetical protein